MDRVITVSSKEQAWELLCDPDSVWGDPGEVRCGDIQYFIPDAYWDEDIAIRASAIASLKRVIEVLGMFRG